MPLKLGLFSMTTGPCTYPDGRGPRGARRGGGRLRVALGRRARGAAGPAGAARRRSGPRTASSTRSWRSPSWPRTPRRIRLGTGIIILPQRNPLVLAKELATLDVISNGRLIFGVGVGYLEPEFRALGVPFEERGRVTDEYLAAMRAIWSEARPPIAAASSPSSACRRIPSPCSSRRRRIVMGGHTRPRSGARCSRATAGTASRWTTPAYSRCLEGLREAAAPSRAAGRAAARSRSA